MAVTTADIKQLRELTGAGILDCKKALQTADGDFDQAVESLRKKGLAAASKKASREANEGIVSAQVSDDGTVGAMVELNCETDFVARTDDFQAFADALVRQMMAQPLDGVEALQEAPFIDNPEKTVAQQLTATIAKLGENMVINKATRFSRQGDGLIDSYIHIGGRVGVLIEVGGATAGAAEVVHDLALQVAAAAPRYITEDEIPDSDIDAEKEIFRAQLANEKKPDNIKERIIEGKLKKWYSEITLLNQDFVKDSDLTVAKLLQQKSKQLGSDLTVRRFARFELGLS